MSLPTRVLSSHFCVGIRASRSIAPPGALAPHQRNRVARLLGEEGTHRPRRQDAIPSPFGQTRRGRSDRYANGFRFPRGEAARENRRRPSCDLRSPGRWSCVGASPCAPRRCPPRSLLALGWGAGDPPICHSPTEPYPCDLAQGRGSSSSASSRGTVPGREEARSPASEPRRRIGGAPRPARSATARGFGGGLPQRRQRRRKMLALGLGVEFSSGSAGGFSQPSASNKQAQRATAVRLHASTRLTRPMSSRRGDPCLLAVLGDAAPDLLAAQGSAKFAVPTWTARRAGEQEFDRVFGGGDAADADDRDLHRARELPHDAQREGLERRAARGRRCGWRAAALACSTSIDEAADGVDRGEASAPASSHASAHALRDRRLRATSSPRSAAWSPRAPPR